MGTFVFTFSFALDATFGLGAYASINFAFDDKGNTAIQLSYVNYDHNGYVGVMDASAGASLSFIWAADTVYDLEKANMTNIGGSVGFIGSFGFDAIMFDDLKTMGGFSISGGVGIGVDIHEYTTTVTIWSNNSSYGNNSSKNSTKNSQSKSGKGSKSSTKKTPSTKFKNCPICNCPHIIVK